MSGECKGMPGEGQVKFKISLSKLGKGLVRVFGRSDCGQVVRWSGECQVHIR